MVSRSSETDQNSVQTTKIDCLGRPVDIKFQIALLLDTAKYLKKKLNDKIWYHPKSWCYTHRPTQSSYSVLFILVIVMLLRFFPTTNLLSGQRKMSGLVVRRIEYVCSVINVTLCCYTPSCSTGT